MTIGISTTRRLPVTTIECPQPRCHVYEYTIIQRTNIAVDLVEHVEYPQH